MLDDCDLVSAIASVRADRLKRQMLQWRVLIALLAAAAIAIVAVAALAHAPQPDALAAEPGEPLSIEDALMEAVDPYDEFPQVDWEHWLAVNPAIVGWITIEGTGIDYPIVRASEENPSFYLSHSIDGSVDAKGGIFLDAECEAGLESMHSVIYGHNWNGGLMFADLARYADEGFAASHPRILLQTPSWKEPLEIQCVEVANGTDGTNVIGFSDADEMSRWYQERLRASTIQLGESAGASATPARIYTFCTCADGPGDKRVLVYAMPAMNLRATSRDSASTA